MALWWAIGAAGASFLFVIGTIIATSEFGDLRTGLVLLFLSATIWFSLALTHKQARKDKWPR